VFSCHLQQKHALCTTKMALHCKSISHSFSNKNQRCKWINVGDATLNQMVLLLNKKDNKNTPNTQHFQAFFHRKSVKTCLETLRVWGQRANEAAIFLSFVCHVILKRIQKETNKKDQFWMWYGGCTLWKSVFQASCISKRFAMLFANALPMIV